jgi:hypothetical protein
MVASELLTYQGGELDASLFQPDNEAEVLTMLSRFLGEGLSLATVRDAGSDNYDAASMHWAYHRAYLVIYVRLSRTPSSVSLEGTVSRSYTAAQVKNFKDLSDAHLASFNAIAPPEEPEHVNPLADGEWPTIRSFRHPNN